MTSKQYLMPTVAACTIAMGLASAPASAAGLLKAAVADWTGGAVMCEIIHQVVESELDYKVKRIVMPSGPNVQAGIRASGDKGRLVGCPVAAWECDDTKRMELLGLNYVVTELGSEAAHWAELQAAYKRQEPFIAYAWEPHWIHAALDLVKVDLPAHSDEKWPATGWAEDVTFNYGSPKLLEDHPKVAHVIQNFNLTNAMQAPMILAIDVDGKDVEEVVEEWMASNEDTWKSWLPQ